MELSLIHTAQFLDQLMRFEPSLTRYRQNRRLFYYVSHFMGATMVTKLGGFNMLQANHLSSPYHPHSSLSKILVLM